MSLLHTPIPMVPVSPALPLADGAVGAAGPCRPGRLGPGLALALSMALSTPVLAANSGGSTSTDCGPFYVGNCGTGDEDTRGADVRIDSPPADPMDPDYAVMVIAGGMNVAGGNVIGNSVVLSGAQIFDETTVVGGDACDGDAVRNSVSVGDHVTFASQDIMGGQSCGGAVAQNSVTIGGHARISDAQLFGGLTVAKDASGNRVGVGDDARIDGLSILVGGATFAGRATDNTVSIRDRATLVGDVQIYGGTSLVGDATGNTVEISDQAQLVGGNPLVIGGTTALGNASNNTIRISGQARVQDATIIAGLSQTGMAQGNRIILEGSPDLRGSTLFGGISNEGSAVDGNVLEIRTVGLKAATVGGFSLYRYQLPATVSPGTPILALTEDTCLCDGSVELISAGGVPPVAPGEQVTLMQAPSLRSARYGATPVLLDGRHGLALQYRWGISATPQSLLATLQDVRASEESKSPLEARITPLAVLNQAGDLAAGSALARARLSAQAGAWSSFGVVGGSSSRYQSGSHVDVDGAGAVLGAARRFAIGQGSTTAGPFIEFGQGRYTSVNDFSSGTAHGKGKSRYFGVGLMLHHAFRDTGEHVLGPLGPYVEASLRTGRISTDWRSADLGRSLGVDASWDSSVSYYGAHLGAGTVQALGAGTTADLRLKYLWTHQPGDRVTIAGDTFEFSSLQSQRLNAGIRLNHALGERAVIHASAAWEHEFSGQARATVYGFDLPAPSIQGSTGVFGLGVDFGAPRDRGLTVGASLQAYTGKRQGFGGQAMLRYAF